MDDASPDAVPPQLAVDLRLAIKAPLVERYASVPMPAQRLES